MHVIRDLENRTYGFYFRGIFKIYHYKPLMIKG